MHPVVPGMNISNGTGTAWCIFYRGLVLIIQGRVLMTVNEVMYFTFQLTFQVCTLVNRIYIIRFIIMIISLAFEAKKYKIYRRNIMYNIINPFLYRYQDKFREMNMIPYLLSHGMS